MPRPIPKNLLPHSAVHGYGVKTQNDAGQITYASSRTLAHVRFEPSSKLIKTKDNTEIQLSAIMFFDCVNSLPVGAAFALGDSVQRSGGKTYEVVGGDEPIAARSDHHWEVELR